MRPLTQNAVRTKRIEVRETRKRTTQGALQLLMAIAAVHG
jgi:hypothetical protein